MDIFRRSRVVLLGLGVLLVMLFAKDLFASDLDEGKRLLLKDMDIVGAHTEFDAAAPGQVTSFWRAATIAAENNLLKNKLRELGIFNISNELNTFDAEGGDNYNVEAAVDNIILDNVGAEYSGAWGTLTSPDPANPYGDDCRYHDAGTGANKVTWTPNIITPGYYDVNVWVSAAESNTDAAKYRINHADGYTNVTMNQKGSGHAHWRHVGEYKFNSGTAGSIVLSDESSTGRVVADAVKLKYEGIIIDDTDAGFGLTGSGWETDTCNSDETRNGNYHWHPAGTGAGASWTVGIPDTNVDYLVYATIPPKGPLSDDVTYTVSNVVGGPVKTVHINQNSAIGVYCLGKFHFTSGTSTITLNSSASGKVVADAIRIVPCRPYPNLTEAQTIGNDLLAQIDNAILEMASLDDDAKDFYDVITSAHLPDINESIYIDYGDAKMLEAALYLARMYIKINAAYDQASVDMQTLVVNEGDFDTAMQILDDHTMLFTLLSGAPAALGEAKAALISAIDSYTLASEFIRNRTDSNDHLVAFYSPDQTQEEKDKALEIEGNFRNLSAEIRANLMDPDNNKSFTLNFLELFGEDDGPPAINLDMNLDAFFSSPKNMRSFVNMLRTSSGLVFDHASDPSFDPTIGGILPNTKNEDWNYLFGNGPEIRNTMVTWSGDTPSVSLEWDKSKDPNAASITSYEIFRGTDASMTDGVSVGTVSSPDTTQFTDTSLPPPGNVFYYRVYTYYNVSGKGTAATYTQAEKVILRLYVNINSSSTIEDGTEANPYKNLGETIRERAKTGTWIRVAKGTYHETAQSLSTWNRSGLILEGGYDPAAWTRNVRLNKTIIDATGLGYGNWSSVVGFSYVNGCVIDGFSITGGTWQDWSSGIGIYQSTSITIKNCKIYGCSLAISVNDNSSCSIINCDIDGRKAESAGQDCVNIWGNSSADIINTSISDSRWSGVSIHENSEAVIDNCVIEGNLTNGVYMENITPNKRYYVYGGTTQLFGGDGYHPDQHGYANLGSDTTTMTFYGAYKYYIIVTYGNDQVRIDTTKGSDGLYYGTHAYGNTANWANVGGEPDGLFATVGDLGSGGNIVIDPPTGNTSLKVYIVDQPSSCKEVIVKNSVIRNNSINGVFMRNARKSAEIKNNLITGNSVFGILCDANDSPDITNCTIVNNGQWGMAWTSGAVPYDVTPNIFNNIITGHSVGVHFESASSSSPVINYNDVWGNTGNYSGCSAGPNDILANPIFDGVAGSYYLNQAASPCVNTGSDTAANIGLSGMTTRMDEAGDSGTVDMGYHYFPGKDDIVIDFGPQYGIWIRYNNISWTQLHNISPNSMVTADLNGNGKTDVIIDFGTQYGIWIYHDNGTWTQLHSVSPKSMVTGDLDGNGKADVIIDFGTQYGIWIYHDDGTWTQLHNVSPKSMMTADLDHNGKADIIIDFGDPYGIWIYHDSGTWTQLHNVSPKSIVVGDLDGNGEKDIIIDFGSQYGIWIQYNSSTWTKLHSVSPDSMITGSLN